MGKKFTRQALNALTLAKKAAQSLNHSYIGTEHILAGLLKEPEGRTIWDWAMECMDLPGLAMHCPQHHYLFPAVLLTACAKKERKSEEELLPMLEEAKKRDHRKLGKEMELFTFSSRVGQGLPLWLPKGAALRERLENFLKKFARSIY